MVVIEKRSTTITFISLSNSYLTLLPLGISINTFTSFGAFFPGLIFIIFITPNQISGFGEVPDRSRSRDYITLYLITRLFYISFLYIKRCGRRVILNKMLAWWNFFSHQHGKHSICFFSVCNVYLF